MEGNDCYRLWSPVNVRNRGETLSTAGGTARLLCTAGALGIPQLGRSSLVLRQSMKSHGDIPVNIISRQCVLLG